MTMTSLTATADDKLTEHFESGLPTSAPTAETTATLASGNWRVKGVVGKKDNNSLRAAMSTDGYIITPPLCQPGRITFSHRASGNGKQLVAEKSTDNGATWTVLGTATVSSSTPYGTSSFKCDSREEDVQVLIRLTCKSSTIYIDDVTVTLNTASTAPVVEPDDPTYVTEGTWVPTKPFPTALNTIYIAPDGDDLTGDGTISQPWAGLQKAVDAAKPGTHIVEVGVDGVGKQEIDPGIFAIADKVVCDSIAQCLARGETRNAIQAGTFSEDKIYGEIGELVLGTKPGRESDEEITLFDTTGMGIQDNTTAEAVFRSAKEKGLGAWFEFI